MSPVGDELAETDGRIVSLLDRLDEEARFWRLFDQELDELLSEEWRTEQ